MMALAGTGGGGSSLAVGGGGMGSASSLNPSAVSVGQGMPTSATSAASFVLRGNRPNRNRGDSLAAGAGGGSSNTSMGGAGKPGGGGLALAGAGSNAASEAAALWGGDAGGGMVRREMSLASKLNLPPPVRFMGQTASAAPGNSRNSSVTPGSGGGAESGGGSGTGHGHPSLASFTNLAGTGADGLPMRFGGAAQGPGLLRRPVGMPQVRRGPVPERGSAHGLAAIARRRSLNSCLCIWWPAGVVGGQVPEPAERRGARGRRPQRRRQPAD